MAVEKNQPYKSLAEEKQVDEIKEVEIPFSSDFPVSEKGSDDFSQEQAKRNIYERLNQPGVFGKKITDFINPSKKKMYGNLNELLISLKNRSGRQDFPELQKHYNFNAELGKKGDKITNEEYNILGGMNVAEVTKDTKIGDSLTLATLGAAYSVVDSMTNKNQDFFDLKGGLGDFGRNSLGVLIQNDNPLAKLFLSKKEIDRYKFLYKEMKKEIYKGKES